MSFWNCGRYHLPLGDKTYVMGIVNVTPDSFSGDGTLPDRTLPDRTLPGGTLCDESFVEAAVLRATAMVEQGAHILDIGGESTRPGAQAVSAEDELQRVVPVVQAIREHLEVPISVDTTKAIVARAALEAGADIINDISGATFDDEMLKVLGAHQCGVVLMHLRGTPQTMNWSRKVRSPKSEAQSSAEDVIEEILDFWRERVDAARAAGIADERIALDAGFGFGKSVAENLEIVRRGRQLRDFGFPVLSATSRKSTIGKVLDDAPVEERVWGTAATVALAIANGCDMVRVHDVREMAQVARVADAVTRKN